MLINKISVSLMLNETYYLPTKERTHDINFID
jgi:hypothetical protein